MTIPRIPASLLYVLAGALLAGLLLRGCEQPHPIGPAVVQVDTVNGAAWKARSAELEREMAEAGGRLATLKRQLAGIEFRTPETVTVYDTVLSLVEDTVTLSVAVDGRGRLTQEIALPDSGGHRPATYSPILVGDCDGGLRLEAGRVQCDRARLGHLVAFVGAGAESDRVWGAGLPPPVAAHGEVGVSWSPAFRSLWSAELRVVSGGRTVVEVRRGVRIW